MSRALAQLLMRQGPKISRILEIRNHFLKFTSRAAPINIRAPPPPDTFGLSRVAARSIAHAATLARERTSIDSSSLFVGRGPMLRPSPLSYLSGLDRRPLHVGCLAPAAVRLGVLGPRAEWRHPDQRGAEADLHCRRACGCCRPKPVVGRLFCRSRKPTFTAGRADRVKPNMVVQKTGRFSLRQSFMVQRQMANGRSGSRAYACCQRRP